MGSSLLPWLALLPVLIGTHMAAYLHGKARGIAFSRELRRSLSSGKSAKGGS